MPSSTTSEISSRVRKTALAASAAAAAIAVFAFALPSTRASSPEASAAAPAGPAVTVDHPSVKTITEWDEFTGRFTAVDDVEIRARVSGYLEEIAFEDGAIVQKGDLLFKIDPRPFIANLAAANADLAGAAADVRNARAESERGQRLLEREAVSEEEAERRTRTLRQAEAGWAAAKARVDQAALNLEFTEVRAPITGRISDDFVSEGNLINGGPEGGTLLTTIVSLDPIYFEFTASESDYLKYVRLGQDGARAGLQGDANPVSVKLIDEDAYAHDGALSFVDRRFDPSTGTMRGRATFANPDGVLSPGMFGRLRVAGSAEHDAVMIADSAVQTDQNQKYVWVAGAGDIAERRVVELGPVHDGLRIVRAGLDRDDRVIVRGTQFVAAGAPVAPTAAEAKEPARLAQAEIE